MKRFSFAFAAICLSVMGCASAPPPEPRLVTARQNVERIQSDPAILAASPDVVERAKVALSNAEDAWRARDQARFVHDLRMVNGNVRLADSKASVQRSLASIQDARQRRVAAEMELARRGALSAQAQAARTRAIAAEQEQENRQLRAQVQGYEQQIRGYEQQLASYDQRQTDLGTLITLSGVIFATDSSALRPGAEQKLQPLAQYLNDNEAIRARIDGHTDSQGAEAYNQRLSKARAEAVATFLARQGVERGRLETFGNGESKPIASNATAAGRAQNRRVEVTILKLQSSLSGAGAR